MAIPNKTFQKLTLQLDGNVTVRGVHARHQKHRIWALRWPQLRDRWLPCDCCMSLFPTQALDLHPSSLKLAVAVSKAGTSGLAAGACGHWRREVAGGLTWRRLRTGYARI